MDKNGVLTISNFQVGQAQSPYLGFDTMRNVDIFSTPGVARVSYRTNEVLSTNGLPSQQIIDKYSNTWTLIFDTGSGNSALYLGSSIHTTLNGLGWDMVLYKDYIIIRNGSSLTAVETTTPSKAVFQSWSPTGISGLSPIYYGKMLVSKSDGNLYIANGTDIKRISAFTAGAPFVAPTATMDTAITLPTGYACTTIAELGSRLMVGTQTDSTIWVSRYASREAVIFPYRIGVSATNFDDPVTITNATSIQQIVVSNNLMYITAGVKGNIYISNGTSYQQIRRLPFYNEDNFGLGIIYYPNAITIASNGNLLIGTSSYYNGYFGDNAQHGVWEINLATGKYEANLKHTISTGTFNGTGTFAVGYVKELSPDLLSIGWQDSSNYGVDNTEAFMYGEYKSVIETQVYVVGNKLNLKTFEHIEILFGRPLTLAQGIKVYYRKNNFGDYTLINTWDYSTEGGVISIRDKALITNAQMLQIKIEMTAPYIAGVLANQNIDLLSVTLW